MTDLLITMPIKTISGANSREHWAAKARRVKKERQATALYAGPLLRGMHPLPRLVTFTRLSPGLLDEGDNLNNSCKAIRDEVALLLGTHDGPTGPVRWAYDQRKAKTYGVEILIQW